MDGHTHARLASGFSTSSGNLDSYKSPSLVQITSKSITNGPLTTYPLEYVWLLVIGWVEDAQQILFTGSADETYCRYCIDKTWSEWEKFGGTPITVDDIDLSNYALKNHNHNEYAKNGIIYPGTQGFDNTSSLGSTGIYSLISNTSDAIPNSPYNNLNHRYLLINSKTENSPDADRIQIAVSYDDLSVHVRSLEGTSGKWSGWVKVSSDDFFSKTFIDGSNKTIDFNNYLTEGMYKIILNNTTTVLNAHPILERESEAAIEIIIIVQKIRHYVYQDVFIKNMDNDHLKRFIYLINGTDPKFGIWNTTEIGKYQNLNTSIKDMNDFKFFDYHELFFDTIPVKDVKNIPDQFTENDYALLIHASDLLANYNYSYAHQIMIQSETTNIFIRALLSNDKWTDWKRICTDDENVAKFPATGNIAPTTEETLDLNTIIKTGLYTIDPNNEKILNVPKLWYHESNAPYNPLHMAYLTVISNGSNIMQTIEAGMTNCIFSFYSRRSSNDGGNTWNTWSNNYLNGKISGVTINSWKRYISKGTESVSTYDINKDLITKNMLSSLNVSKNFAGTIKNSPFDKGNTKFCIQNIHNNWWFDVEDDGTVKKGSDDNGYIHQTVWDLPMDNIYTRYVLGMSRDNYTDNFTPWKRKRFLEDDQFTWQLIWNGEHVAPSSMADYHPIKISNVTLNVLMKKDDVCVMCYAPLKIITKRYCGAGVYRTNVIDTMLMWQITYSEGMSKDTAMICGAYYHFTRIGNEFNNGYVNSDGKFTDNYGSVYTLESGEWYPGYIIDRDNGVKSYNDTFNIENGPKVQKFGPLTICIELGSDFSVGSNLVAVYTLQ